MIHPADHSPTSPLAGLSLTAIALFLLTAVPARAQQPGQARFVTPELASEALFKAAHTQDEKALLAVLGPDGRQLVASGDPAEDAAARDLFVEKYQEMHRLVAEPDGSAILYLGAGNWPTPIPLRERQGGWFFDTEAGRHEILYRRIGLNETSTIRVCLELAKAQEEFKASHHDTYATNVDSGAGAQDGLYWPAAPGVPPSPIGPLVAAAMVKGDEPDAARPFRGYRFRMLAPRGPGFTFVAYPAQYRSSGVMTFRVDQTGVVYEKDLGRQTARRALALQDGHPDATWKKTDEHPE